MRTRYLLLIMFLMIGALLISLQPVFSQAETSACPTFVRQALEQLGDQCGGMERNSACYGYNRVDATFTEAMDTSFFNQPSDRATLVELEKIATAPLDQDLERWGIAVMNVQANVPSALPGQAVTFMLLGDTEVENAVEPESARTEADSITVLTLADTNIHSGPSDLTNIFTSVPTGTALQADGVSEDRGWLRIRYETGPAWVNRNALEPSLQISKLPIKNDEELSPMQAFYFRTSFNDLLCSDAPSILAIQSPEGIKVDLRANGAHISLGSLIMLRIIPPGNAMQIITIEGTATLEPGTPNEVIVPAGYSTQRCLSEPESLGIDGSDNDKEVYPGCQWLYPVLLTEEEQALAQLILQTYQSYGANQIPVGDETVTVVETQDCSFGQVFNHIVNPGETLFQLGLRYNTNINALMFANNLLDTSIFAGQQLLVTCGALGSPTLPLPPTEEPVPVPVVDCSGFQATSPLGGLPYGSATFYWNPAPGATGYRVNISGESGTTSYSAGGSTSVTGSTTIEAIGYGFSFTWNVDALLNGVVICSTPGVTMFREAPPEPPQPTQEPTLTPEQECIAQGGRWITGEGEFCDFGTEETPDFNDNINSSVDET